MGSNKRVAEGLLIALKEAANMDINKVSDVVMLVGLPASGKSTYATTTLKDHIRINQDTLGNRQKCESMVELNLALGNDIVIDRCNSTVQQRKNWINICKKYNISPRCVVMNTSLETCLSRIVTRKGHPTIGDDLSDNEKKKIVCKFFSTYEDPQIGEGFSNVTIIDEPKIIKRYTIKFGDELEGSYIKVYKDIESLKKGLQYLGICNNIYKVTMEETNVDNETNGN